MSFSEVLAKLLVAHSKEVEAVKAGLAERFADVKRENELLKERIQLLEKRGNDYERLKSLYEELVEHCKTRKPKTQEESEESIVYSSPPTEFDATVSFVDKDILKFNEITAIGNQKKHKENVVFRSPSPKPALASNSSILDKIRDKAKSAAAPAPSLKKRKFFSPNKKDSFKYAAVVRKKDDRKALHGTDCACCQDYYKATAKIPRPDNISEAEHLRMVSRHKFVHLPPSTPKGFWDVDFPET